MSITIGNPITITSGTYGTIMQGAFKVNRVLWLQPNLQTSGVIIRKDNSGGVDLLNLLVEASGQSQTMDYRGKWWNNPFVVQVPTGTLYIDTE